MRDLEAPGHFLALEELAQKVVDDLPRNLDDVLVPRDGQLGLVVLRSGTRS